MNAWLSPFEVLDRVNVIEYDAADTRLVEPLVHIRDELYDTPPERLTLRAAPHTLGHFTIIYLANYLELFEVARDGGMTASDKTYSLSRLLKQSDKPPVGHQAMFAIDSDLYGPDNSRLLVRRETGRVTLSFLAQDESSDGVTYDIDDKGRAVLAEG